jgi:hypothetical protein
MLAGFWIFLVLCGLLERESLKTLEEFEREVFGPAA